jgi:hypothetical protein
MERRQERNKKKRAMEHRECIIHRQNGGRRWRFSSRGLSKKQF